MKKIYLSSNLAWFLVLFGGFVEIFWVSGLKYSENFLQYCLTALGVLSSFICMIVAVKKIEVSVAYAVFVGIGTAGVVIAEILIFNEEFSLLKIFFVFMLLVGVIGLKLVSKEENQEDKKIANKFSKEIGIDDEIEIFIGDKK